MEWLRSNQAIADDLHTDPKLGIRALNESKNHYLLLPEDHRPPIYSSTTAWTSSSPASSREFDVLIFDTPPVGVFYDAALIE